MSYDRSLVVICPSAVRDDLIMLGQMVNVDGGMDVKLSSDGIAPETHYGSHAWVRTPFAMIMMGQAYPDPLPDGVTTDQIDAVLGACTVSVDATDGNGVLLDPVAHFNAVAASLGLQIIEVALP